MWGGGTPSLLTMARPLGGDRALQVTVGGGRDASMQGKIVKYVPVLP